MRGRAIGLVVFVATGCGGSPKAAPEPYRRRDAAPAADRQALLGTIWHLVELGGNQAVPGQGGRPATLELTADRRASGFAGCNRMTGTYELQGDSLRLGPLALTRMACQNGMELEQAYVEALQATRTYSVSPTSLELRGESATLARFEAQ